MFHLSLMKRNIGFLSRFLHITRSDRIRRIARNAVNVLIPFKVIICLQSFIGNTESTRTVSHSLKQPIEARYVRFKPKSWNGASICMRAEVYTSQDPGLTSLGGNKLVAYMNFDKQDGSEGKLDKRTKVTKLAGTCGDAGNFHNGRTVVLDVSQIKVKLCTPH